MDYPQVAEELPNLHLLPSPVSCRCPKQEKINNIQEKKLNRSDYLRQNVMESLTWAINRALKYKPTDPKHYIAHQLLKWKCINKENKDLDQWSADSPPYSKEHYERKWNGNSRVLKLMNVKHHGSGALI